MNLRDVMNAEKQSDTQMTELPEKHEVTSTVSLEMVEAKIGELIGMYTKDRTLFLLYQERMRTLRGEIRTISSENQELKTMLSETQSLNQELSRSNDELRNRNGLMLREQQEQLEREVKSTRVLNSKLQIMVNKSDVQEYDRVVKEKLEAVNAASKAKTDRSQIEEEKKKAIKNNNEEIKRIKKELRKQLDWAKRWQWIWFIAWLITIVVMAMRPWML